MPNGIDCCNNQTVLIGVAAINPIWCSRPVHPGTYFFTICSLKSKENIIFADKFFLKQDTSQASHCFEFYLSKGFVVKGLDTSKQIVINTHIDY